MCFTLKDDQRHITQTQFAPQITRFGDVGKTLLLNGFVIYEILYFGSGAVHIGILQRKHYE